MIAVTRFRLREGVDEGDFRAADARYQQEFAYRQPGLLRRTTASSKDGEWVVIDLWRASSDAEGCHHLAAEDPVAQAHAAMVDPGSVEAATYLEFDAPT